MKFTAIILVLALFFSSVGTTLFFFPELQHIRVTMRGKLEKQGEKTEMVFTGEAFARLKWTKTGKEFLFHGIMYDVSSIKKEGRQVWVYCLADKEETGLREQLKDLFSSRPGKSPLRHAVKVLSQKYFPPGFVARAATGNFFSSPYKPCFFRLVENSNPPPVPPPVA